MPDPVLPPKPPDKPEPLLLIAEANRTEGRYGAAILALKQAEALEPGNDPAIQKQLADLYRRDGHPAQAIATLVALREAGQLTDPEILMLARLQARERDPDGAFQTLERIQRERPDDVDAKLAEAEVLLLKGEEDTKNLDLAREFGAVFLTEQELMDAVASLPKKK